MLGTAGRIVGDGHGARAGTGGRWGEVDVDRAASRGRY